MKPLRILSLLIVLGTFLCLNGWTCLPCFVTFVTHQVVPEPYLDCAQYDCSLICPFDQPLNQEEDHEHHHFCPDPLHHMHLIPVAHETSSFMEANPGHGPGLQAGQPVGSRIWYRKGFHRLKADSDPPIFLKNAQLLI